MHLTENIDMMLMVFFESIMKIDQCLELIKARTLLIDTFYCFSYGAWMIRDQF